MRTPKTAKADVAFIRQETQFSCCAASIASALKARGKDVTEAEVKTPQIDWVVIGLGTRPDREIGRDLGVCYKTVAYQRVLRGIPAFGTRGQKIVTEKIDWDSVGLGTISDNGMAKKLGVSRLTVMTARCSRSIPQFKPSSAGIDWTKVPLGEHSDQALADILGVSRATVASHRKDMGIIPFMHKYLTIEGLGANYPEALIDLYWHETGVPHQFQVRIGKFVADWVINGTTVVEYAGWFNHNRWGDKYRERLNKKVGFYQTRGMSVLLILPEDLPKYDLGKLPPVARGHTSSGIQWDEQPLGNQPDHVLATTLRVPIMVVARARWKLKTPSYRSKIWATAHLGEVPDGNVALNLGLGVSTVRRARLRLGIPVFKEPA